MWSGLCSPEITRPPALPGKQCVALGSRGTRRRGPLSWPEFEAYVVVCLVRLATDAIKLIVTAAGRPRAAVRTVARPAPVSARRARRIDRPVPVVRWSGLAVRSAARVVWVRPAQPGVGAGPAGLARCRRRRHNGTECSITSRHASRRKWKPVTPAPSDPAGGLVSRLTGLMGGYLPQASDTSRLFLSTDGQALPWSSNVNM